MRNLLLALLLIPVFITACSRDEKKTEDYTEREVLSQHHYAKKDATQAEQEPKEPTIKKKPLAKVNGVEIYEEDLENGNLDLTVKNEVLFQEAIDLGLDKVVEPQVRDYEKRLLLKLLKQELRKDIDPKVSEEEVAKYYKNHKHEYTLVEVEELITADKEVAEEVRKEALKDTDFQEIVKLHTTEGGQQVTYQQTSNVVVGVFSEAVDLGQVSQVIESDGWFIVQKVINKSSPGFDDLKDTIAIYLTKEKADKEYAAKLENLKKEKNVEIIAQQ